jgi:hypothetical protein
VSELPSGWSEAPLSELGHWGTRNMPDIRRVTLLVFSYPSFSSGRRDSRNSTSRGRRTASAGCFGVARGCFQGSLHNP